MTKRCRIAESNVGTRKQKKDEDNPPPPPPPSPPPPRKRHYQLRKIKGGGFSLFGPTDELRAPRKYWLKVAYDVDGASKAKALKDYHKNDFDLEENIACTGSASDVVIDGQSVSFVAPDSAFQLEATGFDSLRDLIVDVVSREV